MDGDRRSAQVERLEVVDTGRGGYVGCFQIGEVTYRHSRGRPGTVMPFPIDLTSLSR